MKAQVVAFITLFSALLTNGCGSKVNSSAVKEYRVAVIDGDATSKQLVKGLIQDYNSQLGQKAIEYVDSADQANSRIIIVEGLEKRDGKVGWGQWFAETDRSGSGVPGAQVDKTTTYTLQAEFDADFLRQNGKIENGSIGIEVKKLFAHEIGHGFQLEHHPDQNNVMYYDISGTKDFSSYWPRIRSYFAN